MSGERTLSAPLAIIKVNGVPIGKMKTVRVRESLRRQGVKGIGQLYADEFPVTDWEGSLSCSFFTVSYKNSPVPGAILRVVPSLEDWQNTVLLQEGGVQIDIMRKVKDEILPSGIIVPKLEVFASVIGCFLNGHSFDISEGQVSGSDQEFQYTQPILFIG